MEDALAHLPRHHDVNPPHLRYKPAGVAAPTRTGASPYGPNGDGQHREVCLYPGEFLGEDGKPNKDFFELVEDYDNRLQKAKEKSVLPEKPDMKKIENFMIEVNEKIINEELGNY